MLIPILPGHRSGLDRAVFLFLAALFCGSCGKGTTEPTPTLRVISILPAVGSATSETSVVINGTEFAADATVTVGGIAATKVVVQNSTTLNVTVGPLPSTTPAGPADVAVTSGGLTATLANGFTFVAASGANQAPIIARILSIGSHSGQPSGFADLDETVRLVATVTDVETSASALTYEWTGPGLFAGSGDTVEWRLPASAETTPTPMTATLTVTETFVEGSVTHKNISVGTFVMQVHDSQKEILEMGEDFLTLFSRSEVPTNEVLHNFSTTCDGGKGRDDEKTDVDANRARYTQDFGAFRMSRRGPATIAFHSLCVLPDGRVQNNVDACSSFAVHWEVIKKTTGAREITNGVDYVSAALENNRWRICHSDFIPSQGFPTLGLR